MKKIAVLLLLVLTIAGCEGPTHSVLIKNESHYQAVLRLSGHKSNDDRLILAPNQSRTVLFYTFGNAELISKNLNTLIKENENRYVIKDLQSQKYQVHNSLPIPLTLLDNEQHILADKSTNMNISSVNVPCGDSECYFFKQITSDAIILKTNIETPIGTTKYSIMKIANIYYLQATETSQPPRKHKIFIDISSENIIVSY